MLRLAEWLYDLCLRYQTLQLLRLVNGIDISVIYTRHENCFVKDESIKEDNSLFDNHIFVPSLEPNNNIDFVVLNNNSLSCYTIVRQKGIPINVNPFTPCFIFTTILC